MKTPAVFFAFCLLAIGVSAAGAVVSFSPTPPAAGPYDISNLLGAARDRDNVGTATADGSANDETTYIAFDRPAQGQTFRTRSDYPLYKLTAVTVRHVGYSGNNPDGQSAANTWYYMPAGGQFTIRLTEPAQSGSAGFVRHSETYVLSGTEENLFAAGAVANTPDGTGTWVTFTLDTPILLAADTLYGFDISANVSAFFESWGIKDTADGGNPYPAGTAYISGAAGAGGNSFSLAPGERVFVVHLIPQIPENGDLTGNGKVDLDDMAALAAGWKSIYDLSALVKIAAHWLLIEPPAFRTEPILKTDACVQEPYSESLTDDIIYYDIFQLSFCKISGPDWLTVSPEGLLSGTPEVGDLGVNLFTIEVRQEQGVSIQAVLQITVKEGSGPIELLQAVPFTQVHFTDDFWLPRQQTNQQVTIPYVFSKLEETGRIDNFAIAGGLMTGTGRYNFPFDDTDVYKTLEGASYTLQVQPNPALDEYLDELIVKIAAAQANNGFLPGYLYTIRTNGIDIWCGPAPWTNLQSSHELYNAGHLFEAAMAHYQATGKTSLLQVAKNFADLLVDTFHEGGVEIPPGHEIVESALARLYEVTGNPNYLTLARYYLDIRGTVTDDYSPWGPYYQDHLPVLQQTEAVGHVVRALYLYMGMADVAARTDDAEYRQALMAALDSIWHSVNDTKMYITGGLGAMAGGESFGAPYELPHNGYCETCAQIANVMWNYRMFLYYRDSRYIDALERTLYNALLSGVSLQGNTFFYPNPLISTGGYTRSGWFSCNCCIGNIARTIPSLSGYVYSRTQDKLYINLYAAGTAEFPLADTEVAVIQAGGYPWDGKMTITVSPAQPAEFTIYLRIPGWAQNHPVPGDLYTYADCGSPSVTLDVNGTIVPLNLQKGYAAIRRTWQSGDQIHLSLPMAVRLVRAHPNVSACRGQAAVERGPIVYCAEWPDFAEQTVFHLYIPDSAVFESEYRDNMLGESAIVNKGCIIRGTVKGLYEAEGGGIEERQETFTAIPYYAWAHRGAGPMTVWFPTDPNLAVPVSLPSPPELIGYWRLDETSGTAAADSSGKGMNGTLMNGLSFSANSVPGKVNTALSFDGRDDYIDLPDGFDDFRGGCTISLWVYPTAVKSWARFIDFGNGAASDNIWFGRQGSTSNLAFECWSGSSVSGLVVAENAISLNEWQMFTVTADSFGNVRLFKNGQLIQTGTAKPSSIIRTCNYIGRSNWSADAYYAGRLDEIRIYNYNLDDAAVSALYNGM